MSAAVTHAEVEAWTTTHVKGKIDELSAHFKTEMDAVRAGMTTLQATADTWTTQFTEMVGKETAEYANKIAMNDAKVAEQLATMEATAEKHRAAGNTLQQQLEASIAKGEETRAAMQEMQVKHDQSAAELNAAMRETLERLDRQATVKLEEMKTEVTKSKEDTNEIVTRIRFLEEMIGKISAAKGDPWSDSDPWGGKGGKGGGAAAASGGEGTAGAFNISTPFKGDGTGGQDDLYRDSRRRGLCNHRDLEIAKLSDQLNKEQFILWREQLEELLEQSPGWRGISKYTKQFRECRVPLTPEKVVELAPWLNENKTNTMNLAPKSEELYGLLKMKCNTACNALCKEMGDERNGFELYRLMSREYDPRSEGIDIALFDQIMMMGKRQSKNFEETYLSMKKLARLILDYNKVSEQPIEERMKTWAAWELIDPVTQGKADMKYGTMIRRDFQKMRDYLEELYLQSLTNSVYAKVGKGTAMDVSALTGCGAAGCNGCDAPPTSPSDGEKYTHEEWAEWYQSPEYSPVAENPSEWNHIDGLKGGKKGGKGWGGSAWSPKGAAWSPKGGKKGGGDYGGGKAGKGGGWQPMACHTCNGKGHPARVCPTPVGSTSTIACNICQGNGHIGRDCTSYGGGKYLPPSMRGKGGKRGVSAIDDQDQGTANGQGGKTDSALQPGLSMMQQWLASGPWMGTPQTISSVQGSASTGTGPVPPAWAMKVIRSLDKKIKAYKPDYSSEPDDEEPEATMTIRQGCIQKCKNGKKSLRPVKSNKKDWTADKSFDQWLREEEVDGAARKDAVEDCEDREHKQGPTVERSIQHVNDTGPRVGKSPEGCSQAVDRTAVWDATHGNVEDANMASRPAEETTHQNHMECRSNVSSIGGSAGTSSDVMEDAERGAGGRPVGEGFIPEPPVGGKSVDVVVDVGGGIDNAEIANHWTLTGTVPLARMNIADRKKAKKERDRERRDVAYKAATEYEEMTSRARRGYEIFHQLPRDASTCQQVESTSCGILGWAKYAETLTDEEIRPREVTLTGRLADSIVVDDCGLWPVLGSSNKPRSHIDILTKIDQPTISVVRPQSRDGWEEIEITVDSGACDTVLPSRMLPGVKLEETEASRRGEEYEVANGHSMFNEGEKRCVMTTKGSSTPKGIVFQVSDVHKPLMSVGSMADAGFECLLGKYGGIMRDVDSGEMIPLERRGNLYHFKAWVRTAEGLEDMRGPFGRQV